tara:strand:+ start:1951 stop:2220 length:270 start_codon:yes stop_codon:yes gene_type:complete
MEILGYIFICTTAMLAYSTYNLMIKVEHLENVIDEQDNEYFILKEKTRNAISAMREIDTRQAFEKEDEVGQIFTSLLSIVESLGEDSEE